MVETSGSCGAPLLSQGRIDYFSGDRALFWASRAVTPRRAIAARWTATPEQAWLGRAGFETPMISTAPGSTRQQSRRPESDHAGLPTVPSCPPDTPE